MSNLAIPLESTVRLSAQQRLLRMLYDAYPLDIHMNYKLLLELPPVLRVVSDEQLALFGYLSATILQLQRSGLIDGNFYQDGVYLFFWSARFTENGYRKARRLIESSLELSLLSMSDLQ